jgi:phosphopantothenoylcysteine decarboxylase/phosphopantothenate--cysteine ligase
MAQQIEAAPKVLLGVCGGIAAYKAVEIVRSLQQQGIEVRVIMTSSAQQFVQPLTFSTITGHKVYTSLWEEPLADPEGSQQIEHIALAQWADALVIAPATANTLATLSHGLAGDVLAATYLACTAPVVIAPAMNVNMWNHAATQANVATLKSRGHVFVAPESGYLACGMTGDGRLADTSAIVAAVLDQLQPANDLAGETVLITTGGTREPIDPVRFLGNRSSGRMGFALAAAAHRRGARVIVVAGTVSVPAAPGCEVVSVQTAAEMQAAVLQHLPDATMVIGAAAVADFRARHVSTHKLERDAGMTLELEPTEDIMRLAAARRVPGTLVIAFAAEMGLDRERARQKLSRKGADAIVLNNISQDGTGFDSERNAVVFLTADDAIEMREATKDEIAEKILDQLTSLRSMVFQRYTMPV